MASMLPWLNPYMRHRIIFTLPLAALHCYRILMKCEFTNLLTFSFVFLHLIYRQLLSWLSPRLVHIPHTYEPLSCTCILLFVIAPFSFHITASPLLVHVVLPVTLGTFWWDLLLPISSNFAQHSMQLPAAGQ